MRVNKSYKTTFTRLTDHVIASRAKQSSRMDCHGNKLPRNDGRKNGHDDGHGSKLIFIAIVLVLAGGLVATGITYAVLTITAPGSLTYNAPPAHTTLQSFTAADCAAMPTYNTVVLTDTRDSKDYRVRKMPDGKCWMVDNLKLGGTGTEITLNSTNSNVTSDFTIPANAITTSTERATKGICNSTVISATGTDGYLTCDGTTTVTGTDDNENYNFAAYVDPASTGNSLYDSCQHGAPGLDPNSTTDCGYLYNWYTATAGTGVYDTPADTTVNANAAPASICPAGWHLPKAGTGSTTGNEFATLNGAMYNGGTAATSTDANYTPNWQASGPFAGSYSGYYNSGFNYQGNYGYYWSSSASSSPNARNLYFYYLNVNPGNYTSYKYYGMAVRCVI